MNNQYRQCNHNISVWKSCTGTYHLQDKRFPPDMSGSKISNSVSSKTALNILSGKIRFNVKDYSWDYIPVSFLAVEYNSFCEMLNDIFSTSSPLQKKMNDQSKLYRDILKELGEATPEQIESWLQSRENIEPEDDLDKECIQRLQRKINARRRLNHVSQLSHRATLCGWVMR